MTNLTVQLRGKCQLLYDFLNVLLFISTGNHHILEYYFIGVNSTKFKSEFVCFIIVFLNGIIILSVIAYKEFDWFIQLIKSCVGFVATWCVLVSSQPDVFACSRSLMYSLVLAVWCVHLFSQSGVFACSHSVMCSLVLTAWCILLSSQPDVFSLTWKLCN